MQADMTVRDLLDALDETDAATRAMRDVITLHEQWLREVADERREIIRELSRQGYEIDWG